MKDFLAEARAELDFIDVTVPLPPPPTPPCSGHVPATIEITTLSDFDRRYICARCGYAWNEES